MAAGRSILKALNPDDIRRSIVVANMTPGTKEEAIFIHFQQRKHGGGDVSSVRLTQDGDKAVITFEEAESESMNTCAERIKAYVSFLASFSAQRLTADGLGLFRATML